MRNILLVTAMILFVSGIGFGQSNQSPPSDRDINGQQTTVPKVTDLPLPKRGFHPKLTLQQALKIAEEYTRKQKISLSSYYLFEAKWIMYGTETKEPRWYFWWINESGAIGDYVQITISMDRKPQLLGSM
jgi:hypothetical protein